MQKRKRTKQKSEVWGERLEGKQNSNNSNILLTSQNVYILCEFYLKFILIDLKVNAEMWGWKNQGYHLWVESRCHKMVISIIFCSESLPIKFSVKGVIIIYS